MTKYFLLAFVFLYFISLSYESQVTFGDNKILRFISSDKDDFIRFVKDIDNFELDIWVVSQDVEKGHFFSDIRVSSNQLSKLGKISNMYNIQNITKIENLQENIDRFNKLQDVAKESEDFFDAYRNYNETNAFLFALEEKYPELVSIIEIGESYEGRMVYGISISNDPGAINRQTIVYLGNQHAREWISCMTVSYLAQQFCENYEKDPVVKQLLQTYQYVLIPISNPDGYEYSINTNRMWRKNRRENENSNCYGVDINRNWDYEYNTGGSSSSPCSDTYRGVKAFSEPETANVALWANREIGKGNQIIGYIDFHCYGQYFFNPWGWTTQQVPSFNQQQQALASQAVSSIYSVHQKTYTIGNSAKELYVASGGSDDWFYGSLHAPYSYTVELRPGPNSVLIGFTLPPEEIIDVGEEIYQGMLTFGQYILDNPVSGP